MKPHLFAATLAFCLPFGPAWAAGNQPVRLVSTTPLPEITGGDFDHFAADLKGNRLYVVAETYGSIEVFDLRSGKHLRSVRDVVKSPRKILYLADKNQLFVADAGSSACLVLDADTLQTVATIPLEAGPDAGIYDPHTRIFYVGNGGRAAHKESSYVTAISVDEKRVLNRVEVPAATLKTLVLDERARKLYATMRDKNQVAVIDLQTNKLERTFSDPSLHTDSAMAADFAHHRLFVGNRKPGQLLVLDSQTGKPVATLPTGETSDDITYDASNRLLYITSDDGLDVVRELSPGQYEAVQHVDTFGGKTSVYLPSLKRLYVVHTKSPRADVAGLQMFSVE
jgi:DNA-binding beta-propeller fold protein YncE